MRLKTYAQDFPVDLKVVEFCFFHAFDFEMHTLHQVAGAPQIHNWWMIHNL